MEFKTKSMTIEVRPDDIVEVINNEYWDKPDTIETATENAKALKKAVDKKQRGILRHLPDHYIGKEVLECYINGEIDEVATALLITSYGSKVVGNLYLKLIKKYSESNDKQATFLVDIFTEKEAAEKWLLNEIAKRK